MKRLSAVAFAGAILALQPVAAELLPLESARVTLPYTELKALLESASAEAKAKPPVASSVISASYDLEMGGEVAAGTAVFEVQSFSDEWQVIPLLGTEARLVRVEPPAARLVVREGKYCLLTDTAGAQTVAVEFELPVKGVAGLRRFALDGAEAISSALVVTGVTPDRRVTVPGATRTGDTFRLPRNGGIVVEVRDAEEIVTSSEWTGQAQVVAVVQGETLQWRTLVTLQTDAGSALEAEMTLPEQAREIKVESEDLADWETGSQPGGRGTVHLQWKTRDVRQRKMILTFETPTPAIPGIWRLGGPEVSGKNGETILAIVADDRIELTQPSPSPRTHLPRWMEEAVAGRAHALSAGPAVLEASWLPLAETATAVIQEARSQTRIVPDGALLNEITYAIQHEEPVTWTVRLPAESELLTCSVNNRPVAPVARGDGQLELRLPAGGSKPTTVSLSYTGRKPPLEPVSGRLSVELPLTPLLIHAVLWEIAMPEAYELAALEGNVVPAGVTTKDGLRVSVRKELTRNERPAVEIFYRKPVK